MLRLGQADTALVVGAEAFSRILGGMIVEPAFSLVTGQALPFFGQRKWQATVRTAESCLHIYSDGAHYDITYVDGGPSTTGRRVIYVWKARRFSACRPSDERGCGDGSRT